MRILSIDYGDKRCGFAICDPMRIIAQGLDTLHENNKDKVIRHIKKLISDNEVTEILLGYPINMNGTVGERGIKTKAFAEELERTTGIKVTLRDERLTTVMSHKILSESNTRGSKRKANVDKLSAVLILQQYLDSLAATS